MSSAQSDTNLDIKGLQRSCATCSLRQLCLPADISSADVERLDRIVADRRPLSRGQMLFQTDMPFKALFVVRSGAMKTVVENEDGDEQIVGFHLPGELFGLDAIDEGRHRCSAEALERTSLCEIPFDQLEDIAGKLPSLRHALFRIISREMAAEQRHLVLMSRRSARERLAIFLRSLSRRYERRGYSASGFNLSMSRYDLANYLGLAVETVSRLFTSMQEDGVLNVERKDVEILDPARLCEMAGESAS